MQRQRLPSLFFHLHNLRFDLAINFSKSQGDSTYMGVSNPPVAVWLILKASSCFSPSPYLVGVTNVNNHFGFSPNAGTNITRLILREPFDFSSGVDKLWVYSLAVLISDANLRAGRAPQTGTIIINVQVVDPDLTTTMTTTTVSVYTVY